MDNEKKIKSQAQAREQSAKTMADKRKDEQRKPSGQTQPREKSK